MYAVSSLWSRGLSLRSSTVTSTLGGKSLGNVIVESGTLSWSSDGRKVTSQLTLSVADPKGLLATPTGPLGWFGQQMLVRSGVSRTSYTEMIPCGSFRVDDSGAGPQAWSTHRNGVVVLRGGVLSPTATDLLSILEDDDLIGLEQPLPGGTVRSEIVRLVGNRMPIASTWPGVSDPTVPSTVTYDKNRLTTICTLAALVNAVVWAGRAGELRLLPVPSGAAVWSATSRQATQIIIPGSRTGMYNRVIAEATDANGAPLVGVADVLDGPLAAKLPYGVVSYRHTDPLSKTQDAVDATARTILTNLVAQRTVRVRVKVPADPCLDPLDMVSVTDPKGRVFTGPVVSCSMPLEPGEMTIEIPVPMSTVL